MSTDMIKAVIADHELDVKPHLAPMESTKVNYTDRQLDAAYSAGTKAGYNQCRTEAAIRITGLERDYDTLKRRYDCSVALIRDLVADLGVSLSRLPSMQRAHDYLEQNEDKP